VASAVKLPEKSWDRGEEIAREVEEVLREVERLRARLLSLRARVQRELNWFGYAHLAYACAYANYVRSALSSWLKDFMRARYALPG
jgi:hypothetical protein